MNFSDRKYCSCSSHRITTRLACLVSIYLSTGYSLASDSLINSIVKDGATADWAVYDDRPGDALVIRATDTLTASSVVELLGEGLKNGALLGSNHEKHGWNVQDDFIASWEMNFSSESRGNLNTEIPIAILQHRITHPSILSSAALSLLVDGKLDDHADFNEWSVDGSLSKKHERSYYDTNPIRLKSDFTQLGSRLDNTDFKYEEKLLTDKRTISKKGDGYLGSNESYFYSRRIPDFKRGIRSYGKINQHQWGKLLGGSDNNRQDFVARYKSDIGEHHWFRSLSVLTDQDAYKNQLLFGGIGAEFVNGFYYSLDIGASNAYSDKNYRGQMYDTRLGWSSDIWNVGVSSDYFSTEYGAEIGLLPKYYSGTHAATAFATYSNDKEFGLWSDINSYAEISRRNTSASEQQNEDYYINAGLEVADRLSLLFAFQKKSFSPDAGKSDLENSGTTIDQFYSISIDFQPVLGNFGLGSYVADGERSGGDYFYTSSYFWAKPHKRLDIRVGHELLDNFGKSTKTTVNAVTDLTKKDELSARYFVAGSDEKLRLTYRRKVKKGFDIASVLTMKDSEENELSVKFSWTAF